MCTSLPMRLRRDHGLLGDGNVAGPSRNHDDLPFAVDSLVLRKRDRPREFVECGLAKLALYCAILLRRNPSRQHVVAGLRETREMAASCSDDLSRSDNFRHANSQRAMIVHIGEAKVFERKMAQPLYRFLGRTLPTHIVEQFLDGVGSHGAVLSCQLSVKQWSLDGRCEASDGRPNPCPPRTLTIAVTGASGFIFARRLLNTLDHNPHIAVDLIVSDGGLHVMAEELQICPRQCSQDCWDELRTNPPAKQFRHRRQRGQRLLPD